MMRKNSALHIPCSYCDKEALPDTYPPCCEEHKVLRKEAGGTQTLKELESRPADFNATLTNTVESGDYNVTLTNDVKVEDYIK